MNRKTHDRISDTELLIKYFEESKSDNKEIIEAIKRLKECHKEKLLDYGFHEN